MLINKRNNNKYKRKERILIASFIPVVNTEEPLMTINRFNLPHTVKNEDAAILLIIRLILLEPGTIQTHPNCGVGLVSMFRYSTEVDLTALKRRITTQISTFLPMFTMVDVDLELDDKKLKIYITSEQLRAMIPINTETGAVLNDMKS